MFFTSFYKKNDIYGSDKSIIYSCLYWFGDDYVFQISDQFWGEKKKTGTWHWCLRTPRDLVVRCVTCAERPLWRKVLFREQPHPEHHEDDYFHPPHPTPPYTTPGLRVKTQHANPACPNRLGTDIQIMTLLLSFLSLSLISPYAVHILQLNPVALV